MSSPLLQDLIVRLSRRIPPEEILPAELELLRAPGGTQSFLDRTGRHGVRGLVLRNLRAALPESIRLEPAIAGLLLPLALLRKQAALWELEQERILLHLGAEGPRTLVLKGGALRHVVYEDPIERWMGDLDLLVHPTEVSALIEALCTLGYTSEYSAEAKLGIEAHHYHHLVTHPTGFIVEVHQGLTRPGAAFHLEPAPFLERAQERRTRGGVAILVPSAEDMVLHLVSQIEQEGGRRLSRFVDIDRVVATAPTLDWTEVENRARQGNLTVGLALSLRLAHLLFFTPAPRIWLEGRPLGPATRLALGLLAPPAQLFEQSPRGTVAADDLLRFWLLPTWRLRLTRLQDLLRRRGDPLQWVWEGKEAPDGADLPATGGPIRLLKLLTYQGWTLAPGMIRPLRRPGSARVPFWARTGAPALGKSRP